MQITVTGTIEEIKAFASTLPNVAKLSSNTSELLFGSDSATGPAFAKVVEVQRGNNKKFLDFLLSKKNVPQNADTIADELSVQVNQLNGPLGAINKRAADVTGKPLILKKKRGRKMCYWINPDAVPYL